MATRTCAVDGCDRPYLARGLCARHYKRWRATGEPVPPPTPERTCPACGSAFTGRPNKVYCSDDCRNLALARRNGVEPFRPRGTCAVDGCERPHHANGYCDAHNRRLRDTGDVRPHEPFRVTGIPETYEAAHRAIRRARGPAKHYACIDCGRGAEHWSYDHADPDARTDPNIGAPYSPDPWHYQPRCVSCHKRYDLAFLDAAAPGSA